MLAVPLSWRWSRRRTQIFRSGFNRRTQQEGVICRVWTPRTSSGTTYKQIVLPKPYCDKVIKLAHDLPFAGHLGREKTAQRILRRFYWPMLFHDIKQYCQTCEKCQLHGGCKTRAPMFLLLTIGEPFKRIALDVVGPLPRTGWGNHFILVVSDYATRFPKAIPLRSVTAKKVAEVLIDLFARYGIPEEILTDQGSNFTSSLLGELYRLVGIKAMTGYYRRFIRDYATIAEPLTELTRKSLPEEIVWNERAELAYHERSHTLRLSESVWP